MTTAYIILGVALLALIALIIVWLILRNRLTTRSRSFT